MNGKRAKQIRKDTREDVLFSGRSLENEISQFRPVQFKYDTEKNRFIKTARGIPFEYSDSSIRREYKEAKRIYKTGTGVFV